MAAEMMAGNERGLKFVVEWRSSPSAKDTAAERTRGAARLSLGDDVVWGMDEEGLEWTWIELVEHLARAWPYLVLEQAYPHPLQPRGIRDLEAELRRHLEDAQYSDDEVDDLENSVFNFLDVHDLSRGLQGVSVAPLRLMRCGTIMEVAAQGASTTLPCNDVLESLTAIGDLIVSRLDGATDERSVLAAERWRGRAEGWSPRLVAELSTGLGSAALDVADEAWRSEIERSATPMREYDSEVLAAARMTGRALEAAHLKELLSLIVQEPLGDTSSLDTLSSEVDENEGLLGGPPHEDGYRLARWARGRLGFSPEQRMVNVEDALAKLGVRVQDVDLETAQIDAVAVFGRRHGPAIFVNSRGEHAGGSSGRRATLAHELCHLLVDRTRALPFAEAVGGAAPAVPEKRAKAFAAEFLLPQHVAVAHARARESVESNSEVERMVQSLALRHGVSAMLAAWQVRNGLRRFGPDAPERVERHLERIGNHGLERRRVGSSRPVRLKRMPRR